MAEPAKTLDNINIKALLKLAQEEEKTDGIRKPHSVRLYSSGRLNFTPDAGIENGKHYTAKIAQNTLFLYEDKGSKRKASIKTNSTDILFNLVADLRKRTAYAEAVENGKTDGNREYKDYEVKTHEEEGATYFIINLAEHAEAKPEEVNEAKD